MNDNECFTPVERIARALERMAETQQQLVECMAAVAHSNAMLIQAITTPEESGEEASLVSNPLRTMDP